MLFITTIYCYGNNGEDYREFYKFINNAELHISEDNFEDAHKIYTEVFELWTDAPTIDYYNALLCAVKLGEYSNAFNYIEILASRGWELDFFLKIRFYLS